jgi:hypothetical protein
MVKMYIAAAAILAGAGAANAQFEGTVRMKTVTYLDGDSSLILPTAYFKGPLFAAVIDAPPGGEARGGRFILRGDKHVMWIIGDQEKKYIEIPVAKPDPGADSAARGAKRPAYTLTRTGQSKTILGYPCDEWIADEGGGATSSVWATEKLGGIYEGVVKWFDGMSLENAGDRTRWEREIAGMKLFPLLVVRTEEGDVVEREEVLSVEESGVPDRTFEAPAGYEKQSIDPNFEKMFEQMMKEMEKQNPADSTRDDGRDGGI